MICWLGRRMTEMGFSSFLSAVCGVSTAGALPQTLGFFALVSRERLLAAAHSISYFSPRQNTSSVRHLIPSLPPFCPGVQSRYVGVLLTLHLGDNTNLKKRGTRIEKRNRRSGFFAAPTAIASRQSRKRTMKP